MTRSLPQTASAIIALLCLATPAAAQTATPPAPAGKNAPWEITDNSFLVEEAFNQEPRIFQNIFGFARQSGDWQMAFTQEWPAPGMRHQLSYTLLGVSLGSEKAFGDVFLMFAVLFLVFGALAVVMRRPAAIAGASAGH